MHFISPYIPLVAVLVTACATASAVPSAAPSTPSQPATVRLPIAGHRTVAFKWDFEGMDMIARGDGVVRLGAPDSARLDFFLAGGFGAGAAILIGDSLTLPPGAAAGPVRDMLPPVNFLWETLTKIVTRKPGDKVFNVDYGPRLERRKLKLTITNDEPSAPFNSNIWRF